MSISQFRRTRGRILVALALVAMAGIGVTVRVHAANAATAASASDAPWLDKLKGKHRQLFDAPDPNGGVPLIHMMNFYDTYNKAFNTRDADINGILTFYGATTFYGVNDAMWAKYRLGEFTKATDPKTGAPATANPWRTSPTILGMSLPQASIESMQKRGATFIVCNNALGLFAGMLAQARGLPTDSVYNDLKANILPGVTLVPGMVVAIEQAQSRGISYHRQ